MITILYNDREIDVVIFIGAEEKAFVLGADISEIKDKSPQESYIFARQGQVLFKRIQELPQPTIAAINGFALGGGCELAMACDMRIAKEVDEEPKDRVFKYWNKLMAGYSRSSEI